MILARRALPDDELSHYRLIRGILRDAVVALWDERVGKEEEGETVHVADRLCPRARDDSQAEHHRAAERGV